MELISLSPAMNYRSLPFLGFLSYLCTRSWIIRTSNGLKLSLLCSHTGMWITWTCIVSAIPLPLDSCLNTLSLGRVRPLLEQMSCFGTELMVMDSYYVLLLRIHTVKKKGSNSSLLKTILSPYLTSFSRDIPLWEAPAYILAVHLHFADGTKTKQ